MKYRIFYKTTTVTYSNPNILVKVSITVHLCITHKTLRGEALIALHAFEACRMKVVFIGNAVHVLIGDWLVA